MRLALLYREQISGLGGELVNELDQMVSTIGGWAATEHDDDGRHTNVTADSVTTALLTATTARIVNLILSGSITLSGFTPGSVLFAGPAGLVSQDNTNFFWNDTTNALALGGALTVATTLMVGTTNVNALVAINAPFSGAAAVSGFLINPTLTPGVNGTARGMRLAPTLVEAGSGTHPLLVTAEFIQPVVTAGAATVTDAVTVFINDAPTAIVTGNNYALWVKAGLTRLGGITQLDAPVTLKGYTVATLPAGVVGHFAYATDLLAPAFFGAAAGGGAVTGPVFYNGAAWVVV